MKKVLVTTDFSISSKAGVRFAIQMAAQSGCALVFYHVRNPETTDVWVDLLYQTNPSEEEALRERMVRFIEPLLTSVESKGTQVEWMVEEGGDTVKSILGHARKCGADFICLGTRGLGRVRRLFGSTASSLMELSPIPLLVVPYSYRTKSIKSILYASDFAEIRKELPEVTQFAHELGVRVSVYHYEAFLDEAEVEQKLHTLASQLGPKAPAFHFRKLHPEHSLLDHLKSDIRRTKPSVIALFTKQDRNWFERLFLSSKTAELGFDTRTPLLVFRK